MLVRAPRAPFAEVCFFLAERWEWLQHHRSRLLREAPPRTLLFRDGEPILHLGEELVLRLRSRPAGRAVRMGGELHLAVPAHADADNSGVIASSTLGSGARPCACFRSVLRIATGVCGNS